MLTLIKHIRSSEMNPGKAELRTRKIIRDKEKYNRMIKQSILRET